MKEKTINFRNNKQRKHLKVLLNDKNETELLLNMPKKSLMRKIVNLETVTDLSEEEQINEIYEIVASILSSNTTGKTITAQQVDDMFYYDELVDFLRVYVEFIQEVTNVKN